MRFFGRGSKSGPEREDPYHTWIWSVIDAGEYAVASDSAGDWINSNPLDIWAWFYKGLCKTGLSKYPEAIEAFERVIAIEGRSELAWNNKGFALGCLGRYEDAIEAFDKVIAGGFNSGMAWSNKGYVLYQLGRPEEALAAFNKAVANSEKVVNSENSGRINNIFDLFAGFELGRFWDVYAEDEFETWLGLTKNTSWNNQGYVLAHMGRFEEAIRALDTATKYDSHDDVAWTNKGYALYLAGRFEEAIRALDRSLKIIQNEVFACYKKADCLLSLGRTEEAARSLNYAVASYQKGLAKPNFPRFPMDLRERLTDTLQVLDRALRVYPNVDSTWKNKGTMLVKLGRPAEAEECFRRARDLSEL